jgi:hypothetical protein
MLEYQKNKQELIKDLLNERKCLKNSQVNILLSSYEQKDEINHVLKKFGISDDNIGTEYIIEIISNLYNDIKHETNPLAIRSDLKNKNSYIYKTIAYEYFGKDDKETIMFINKEINNVFSKRDKEQNIFINSEVYNIFGGRKNISLVTFMYQIAKYMHTNKMLEKERVFKL